MELRRVSKRELYRVFFTRDEQSRVFVVDVSRTDVSSLLLIRVSLCIRDVYERNVRSMKKIIDRNLTVILSR